MPLSVRVALYGSRYAPDAVHPETCKRRAAEKARCEIAPGDFGSES